jgi:hypothetical protein
VKTWDDKWVAVCQPDVCDDHRHVSKTKLRHKHSIIKNSTHHNNKGNELKVPRWAGKSEEEVYFSKVKTVQGWVKDIQFRIAQSFTKIQHEQGTFGSVMEIGVHHGKFFGWLAGNAMKSEAVIAVDVFENQTANYDKSGGGATEIFFDFMKSVNIPPSSIIKIEADSTLLSAKHFADTYPFRMISIDGGHSVETTLHDFNLAACLIMDGGVVAVDDFVNLDWLGVPEAIIHVINVYSRLVPFMYGANKIWFTTPSHAEQYYQHAIKDIGCLNTDLHRSRNSFSGHVMCQVEG